MLVGTECYLALLRALLGDSPENRERAADECTDLVGTYEPEQETTLLHVLLWSAEVETSANAMESELNAASAIVSARSPSSSPRPAAIRSYRAHGGILVRRADGSSMTPGYRPSADARHGRQGHVEGPAPRDASGPFDTRPQRRQSNHGRPTMTTRLVGETTAPRLQVDLHRAPARARHGVHRLHRLLPVAYLQRPVDHRRSDPRFARQDLPKPQEQSRSSRLHSDL